MKYIHPKLLQTPLAILIFLACFIAAAQTVDVSVSPRTMRAGSEGILTVTINDAVNVKDISVFPKIEGIVWTSGISRGYAQTLINGKSTTEITISRTLFSRRRR